LVTGILGPTFSSTNINAMLLVRAFAVWLYAIECITLGWRKGTHRKRSGLTRGM